jgi:hypothetical protein
MPLLLRKQHSRQSELLLLLQLKKKNVTSIRRSSKSCSAAVAAAAHNWTINIHESVFLFIKKKTQGKVICSLNTLVLVLEQRQ